MKITDEKIIELRKLRGIGMQSSVGEYTPDELWDALDDIESLRKELRNLVEQIDCVDGTAQIDTEQAEALLVDV